MTCIGMYSSVSIGRWQGVEIIVRTTSIVDIENSSELIVLPFQRLHVYGSLLQHRLILMTRLVQFFDSTVLNRNRLF